jgi:prefoldin subunit 5
LNVKKRFGIKKLFLFVIFIFILSLSGCSGNSSTSSTNSTNSSNETQYSAFFISQVVKEIGNNFTIIQNKIQKEEDEIKKIQKNISEIKSMKGLLEQNKEVSRKLKIYTHIAIAAFILFALTALVLIYFLYKTRQDLKKLDTAIKYVFESMLKVDAKTSSAVDSMLEVLKEMKSENENFKDNTIEFLNRLKDEIVKSTNAVNQNIEELANRKDRIIQSTLNKQKELKERIRNMQK